MDKIMEAYIEVLTPKKDINEGFDELLNEKVVDPGSPKDREDLINKIIKDKQMQNGIDTTTAGMLKQALNALNGKNRKKFLNLEMDKMILTAVKAFAYMELTKKK